MVLGGPLSHVMAAKAVALAEARTQAFRDYARRVASRAASAWRPASPKLVVTSSRLMWLSVPL
jgi:glycine/serine hydroxymethyltransferase